MAARPPVLWRLDPAANLGLRGHRREWWWANTRDPAFVFFVIAFICLPRSFSSRFLVDVLLAVLSVHGRPPGSIGGKRFEVFRFAAALGVYAWVQLLLLSSLNTCTQHLLGYRWSADSPGICGHLFTIFPACCRCAAAASLGPLSSAESRVAGWSKVVVWQIWGLGRRGGTSSWCFPTLPESSVDVHMLRQNFCWFIVKSLMTNLGKTVFLMATWPAFGSSAIVASFSCSLFSEPNLDVVFFLFFFCLLSVFQIHFGWRKWGLCGTWENEDTPCINNWIGNYNFIRKEISSLMVYLALSIWLSN